MKNICSLPVLLYHKINNLPHESCVSPQTFEDHCKTLAQAGWRGVSLAEAEGYLLHGRPLPAKSCMLTFDDGYVDNYIVAEPLLRRYGHHGALFPALKLLDNSNALRPTLAMQAGGAGLEIPQGYCTWAELKQMHHHGNLTAAPHSMWHDKAVRGLEFDRLFSPSHNAGHYSALRLDKDIPWGFPCFALGPSLAYHRYELSPELFALIRDMVPQERERADAFLADPENRKAVISAVLALPSLGAKESEEEYRARIGAEFALCREIFRARMGSEPLSFCWPWGSYNPIAVEEAQKSGFRVFFTTRKGANPQGRANEVCRTVVYGNMQGADVLNIVEQAAVQYNPSLIYQTLYERFIRENPEYAGLKRCCNICGYRFSKFKLFNMREAQCPVCKSLERHRHLFIHLCALAPVLKGGRILHFAPETGLQNFLRMFELEYYDADINPDKASYLVDITNMPFEDDFFDYSIAIHVINAIPDDMKAIAELHRVLKPGGTALLMVGAHSGGTMDYGGSAEEFAKRSEHRVGQPVRMYGNEDFLQLLHKAGFETKVADAMDLPTDMREERLLADRIVFARKKRAGNAAGL